jgi:hypothetical protein
VALGSPCITQMLHMPQANHRQAISPEARVNPVRCPQVQALITTLCEETDIAELQLQVTYLPTRICTGALRRAGKLSH